VKGKDIKCTVDGCDGTTNPQNGIVLKNGTLERRASAVACRLCSALYWVTDGFSVVKKGTATCIYLVDGEPTDQAPPIKQSVGVVTTAIVIL
jgi:hypothetical protein